MGEIEIGGKKFAVRGLRLSEVGASKMRKLGYGRFQFAPEIPEGVDQQERLGEIMDAALVAVLGRDGVEDVDRAGGVKGLQAAWRAIMAETYGTLEQEKNLSGAGSGSATPSAETTAPPAGGPTSAQAASTETPPA